MSISKDVKNRKKKNERQKKYYRENKEARKTYALKYREDNREALKRAAAEYRAHRRRERPWEFLLNSVRFRAKQKSLAFDLTFEWAKARWTGRCELCDLPFDWSVTGTPGVRMLSPSIDRMDPSRGYVQDNCRFILFALNAFKGSGDDDQMFRIALALYAKDSNSGLFDLTENGLVPPEKLLESAKRFSPLPAPIPGFAVQ